jgi:hypothetical protein
LIAIELTIHVQGKPVVIISTFMNPDLEESFRHFLRQGKTKVISPIEDEEITKKILKHL